MISTYDWDNIIKPDIFFTFKISKTYVHYGHKIKVT